MKQTRSFCLASASPRRRELLRQFGLEFSVCEVDVDERRLPGERPTDYAGRLATGKAEAARGGCEGQVILAGDTVVAMGEDILGKPLDEREAAAMLRLSGNTHRVLSAYTLLDSESGESCSGVSGTDVTFRALPAEWIAWYSRLPEARDKAGAYAIQGIGGAMVEAIAGSYTTVVGFPMEAIVWHLIRKGWLTL
jgi:septum formation protein